MENIRIVETICDLIDDLPTMTGKPSRRTLITYVKDRPGHDRRYAIDSTKLQRGLGGLRRNLFNRNRENPCMVSGASVMDRARQKRGLSRLDSRTV